jgi:hypothetical protein
MHSYSLKKLIKIYKQRQRLVFYLNLKFIILRTSEIDGLEKLKRLSKHFLYVRLTEMLI